MTEELDDLVERLEQGRFVLDSGGYAELIKRCGKEARASAGRRVHAHLSTSGYGGERFLQNLLTEMYGRCGCLDEAVACFSRIQQPNHFSWTMLISAHSQTGHLREALRLFGLMAANGVRANVVTFLIAIDACSKLGGLALGKKVHSLAVAAGLMPVMNVANALINMYGKCRSLEEARRVFDMVPVKEVVTWNSMIVAYAHNGRGHEAVELFETMNLKPDKVTYVGLADACARIGNLELCRKVHSRMASSGIKPDIILENTILKMYGKCKSLEDTKSMFDSMKDHNLISWNLLVAAYVHNGLYEQALEMYQKMDLEGIHWDLVTAISALDVCASLKALPQGREVHHSLNNSAARDTSVDNAVLNLYARCSRCADARHIFDEMPVRDVISWTAMISAYVGAGQHEAAIKLFRQMNLEGGRANEVTLIPVLDACANLGALQDGRAIHSWIDHRLEDVDVVVANNLVSMYSKCRKLNRAREVFDRIRSKNLFSWTIMVAAYVQHGRDAEAIQLFHRMVAADIEPDNISFSIILHACANTGSLAQGRNIHRLLANSKLEPDPVVENTLLSMYSRSGSLIEARKVFDNMTRVTSGTWNAMMTAYLDEGQTEEALELFGTMLAQNKAKPDKVTFVLALSCCAKKASADEGKAIHSKAIELGMQGDMVVSNTLIDMYGKCGLLGRAEAEFWQMQQKDVFTWSTMISTYAYCGRGEVALELFMRMRQDYTQPNEVTFLEVLFACSHLGLLAEARDYVLSLQEDHGLKLVTGHYACLIDLLARSGKLEEAEDLVEEMPFQPDHVMLTSLLGACSIQGDLKRGIRAAKYVFQLDPREENPYTLLSNIYTAAGMHDEVEKVNRVLQRRNKDGQRSTGVNG